MSNLWSGCYGLFLNMTCTQYQTQYLEYLAHYSFSHIFQDAFATKPLVWCQHRPALQMSTLFMKFERVLTVNQTRTCYTTGKSANHQDQFRLCLVEMTPSHSFHKASYHHQICRHKTAGDATTDKENGMILLSHNTFLVQTQLLQFYQVIYLHSNIYFHASQGLQDITTPDLT